MTTRDEQIIKSALLTSRSNMNEERATFIAWQLVRSQECRELSGALYVLPESSLRAEAMDVVRRLMADFAWRKAHGVEQ